ncbi:helix-turn-helix domain-containing protein [Caulobacter segnis]
MPAKKREYRAPALEKGLDVLELLAAHRGGLTLAQISNALDRSSSELFRMVQVLEARGYVGRAADEDGLVLTNKLFAPGDMTRRPRTFWISAQPVMRAVAQKIGQSRHLALASGDQMVVVARIEAPGRPGLLGPGRLSPQDRRSNLRPGALRVPAGRRAPALGRNAETRDPGGGLEGLRGQRRPSPPGWLRAGGQLCDQGRDRSLRTDLRSRGRRGGLDVSVRRHAERHLHGRNGRRLEAGRGRDHQRDPSNGLDWRRPRRSVDLPFLKWNFTSNIDFINKQDGSGNGGRRKALGDPGASAAPRIWRRVRRQSLCARVRRRRERGDRGGLGRRHPLFRHRAALWVRP